MRPTSLPARLLALTPQGRRLFALLASQAEEIERLRALPPPPPPEPPKADDGEREALHLLLMAARAEAEFNLARLREAEREIARLRTSAGT